MVHSSPNMVAYQFSERGPRVDDYFHWHVEILPRTYSQYKREDEFYTASVMPEEAAAILKGEEIGTASGFLLHRIPASAGMTEEVEPVTLMKIPSKTSIFCFPLRSF